MKQFSKAQMLARLAPKLKNFLIPQFEYLTVREFEADKTGCIASLPRQFEAQS